MSILVRKPGILTTVQDLGRYGHRRHGVNPGGAMDPAALRLINVLLGNDETEAALEMHFPAAEIEFTEKVTLALGGGNFGAELDGRPIPNWHVATASPGSVLRFAEKRKGNRAYLGVAGGFAIREWLGSRSTNLAAAIGGVGGRRLSAADRIGFRGPRVFDLRAGVSRKLVPVYSRFPTVRIIAGAEYGRLTAKGEFDLVHEGYTLDASSNRMGYRLTGEPLHLLDRHEMLSSAVGFGTIQLLPDGQLVILMADHQTTGGYPRVGHVISRDLPLVGQLGPGDGIGFHIVGIDQAESLAAEFRRDLTLLRTGRDLAVKLPAS